MDDVHKDYGLDLRVAVFDRETGTATGQEFYVQLKGTDARLPSDRIRVRTDHFAYWMRMEVPVLFARYHSPTARISATWSWALSFTPWREAQRTVTIHVDSAWLWRERAPAEELEADVAFFFTVLRGDMRTPVRIALEVDPAFTPLSSQVAFLTVMNVDFADAGFPAEIRAGGPRPITPRASVRVTKKWVTAAIGPRVAMCPTALFDWTDAAYAARDVEVLVACVASMAGLEGAAVRLLSHRLHDSALVHAHELFDIVAGLFERSESIESLVSFLAAALDSGVAASKVQKRLLPLLHGRPRMSSDQRSAFDKILLRTAEDDVDRGRLLWATAGSRRALEFLDSASREGWSVDQARRAAILQARLLLALGMSDEALSHLDGASHGDNDREVGALRCHALALQGRFAEALAIPYPKDFRELKLWKGTVQYAYWMCLRMLLLCITETMLVQRQKRPGATAGFSADGGPPLTQLVKLKLDLWHEDTWTPVRNEVEAHGDVGAFAAAALALAVIKKTNFDEWVVALAAGITANPPAAWWIACAIVDLFAGDGLGKALAQLTVKLAPEIAAESADEGAAFAAAVESLKSVLAAAPSRYNAIPAEL